MERPNIGTFADLARIKLSSEEEKKLEGEIEDILTYVGAIVAAGVEETPHTSAVRNVFREDAEPHAPGLYTDKLLAEAPETKENFLKVKKIL